MLPATSPGCLRRYPVRVTAMPPTALMLAAGPGAPGAEALVARARRAAAAGAQVRLLLSGDGLAWAAAGHLGDLPGIADVAVCSRNAREAGWTAADTPAQVRWSSVATWLAELQTATPGALWAVLP